MEWVRTIMLTVKLEVFGVEGLNCWLIFRVVLEEC